MHRKNKDASRRAKAERETLRTQLSNSQGYKTPQTLDDLLRLDVHQWGNDIIRYKMFIRNLESMTLDWFSRLPNGIITDFEGFAKLFKLSSRQIRRNSHDRGSL
ncbi:hypothetical protein CR513_27227, partial [Mucuna pruriens]